MKFRMDSLHYALLAVVVVLLAVYCATRFFREGTYVPHTLAAYAKQRELTELEAKGEISAL